MALFLHCWVHLKMCFRPPKKFKQSSPVRRRELNLWSFTSWLSAEFQEMVQWNCFICWREELPFTREVQQGAYDPRDFLHVLWCISLLLLPTLQLATLSSSTISLLSCWILNLWLCSCFQYLCSLIVCIVGSLLWEIL